MTCSLVVNSKSGNTRMVSGAIKRALQAAGVEFVHAAALSDDADADQVALEAQGACTADTVLVGFWCDKGACTPSVAALLSALHGSTFSSLVPAVLAPTRAIISRLSIA